MRGVVYVIIASVQGSVLCSSAHVHCTNWQLMHNNILVIHYMIVTSNTCLMDVNYSMFDGGLPHDCMHDVLGVAARGWLSLLLCFGEVFIIR